jgi:hypothetical protein
VIAEEKGDCPLPANGDYLLFPVSGIGLKNNCEDEGSSYEGFNKDYRLFLGIVVFFYR